MNTVEKIVLALIAPIFLMIIYMMLVMMPVQAYTEAECLRNGYPKAHVTVGLERYCSNFDGAVTVKVGHNASVSGAEPQAERPTRRES